MNRETIAVGTASSASAARTAAKLPGTLRTPIPLLVLFFFVSVFPGRVAAEGAVLAAPDEWMTPAERFEFRATPTYDETLAFLRRLEKRLPQMKLEFYGDSASGRPMPVVILSAERAFTPAAAQALAKPVVLLLNAIHAGEIDGKDAALMLLRDVALGRRRDLLEATTLLIVPIYNVDGHERVSPWNRPNQDGPDFGMGFRTTADGHDLNRDFLKLQTPEARQLVRLVNAWQPHLVVDSHVTNGVDLDWVITWAIPEAPLLAPPVDRWLQQNFPPVLAEVESAGHRQGPYVSLIDGKDPAQGFETLVYEPRFSTGYFPLRHRPVVLLESHSHKPYRARVLATRDFLAAIVLQTGRAGTALKSAIAEAALAVVQQGMPAAPPSTVAIAYARGSSELHRVPFYDWRRESSVVTGGNRFTIAGASCASSRCPGFIVSWPPTACPVRAAIWCCLGGRRSSAASSITACTSNAFRVSSSSRSRPRDCPTRSRKAGPIRALRGCGRR